MQHHADLVYATVTMRSSGEGGNLNHFLQILIREVKVSVPKFQFI